jgi:hypothetical protein
MLRTQQTLLVKPYRAGQVRVVCLVVGKVGDESVEEGDVAIAERLAMSLWKRAMLRLRWVVVW